MPSSRPAAAASRLNVAPRGMTFISYAQNFEDVLLWRALGSVAQGFYVDVGAGSPDVDSVTRAFYERGWRGIDIEPVPALARLLAAARPRDIVLPLALADRAGTAAFATIPDSGLSTLRPEIADAHAARGFTVERTTVPVETLAAVLARHARGDVHFLKIDVEGSEADVLAGADFSRHRPWIVVVEATAPLTQEPTHAGWQATLVDAGYRHVLFDGLNRFYVAAERHDALAPAFATPPNVFDDFIRVGDTAAARQVAAAEARARSMAERIDAAEAEARFARHLAQHHQIKTSELAAGLHRYRVAAEFRLHEVTELRASLARVEAAHAALASDAVRAAAAAAARTDAAEARARAAERHAREVSAWLAATRRSTSWRLTAPLRRATGLLRRGQPLPLPEPEAMPARSEPIPDDGRTEHRHAEPAPARPGIIPQPVGRLRRAVHQFHSGSAVGDAITNAMLLTRRTLRDLGYDSEIYVEHVDPALAHDLRHYATLPEHDGYVLILRHSTGYDIFERIAALPAPKILLYHNITPPQFLPDDDLVRHFASLGRAQLATLRDKVVAALADSEYNALELRRLGFDAPRACNLLFDIDRLLHDAARRSATRGGDPFTILFVGRVIESKGQVELIEAFAWFRHLFEHPCRLVVVGRRGSGDDAYTRRLTDRIAAYGIADDVILTGHVSDAELHRWYDAADLYVSLSEHEGFGVPLIEAIAHNVPVLAWPSGAVPYTVGDTEGLLDARTPQSVATRILDLARDPSRRRSLVERQRRHLHRFRLADQLPILIPALALAGAAPPERPETKATLVDAMRFRIVGHVNKTYSLAAVNRATALAIERERPGTVRIEPVEGAPTTDLSDVPADVKAAVAALAERPPHPTGPEIVISQHYPVYVPQAQGDVLFAMFFWEESLVPADTIGRLNTLFRAVLAPSHFVAKALIDSGLSIPVHVVGHAPLLDDFAEAARPVRDASAPFTLLHVSSCFPRKGVDVLLAAYARAFRRTDNVRLLIKSFPNPHNEAAGLVARLRDRDADVAPIELLDRDLDRAAMRRLYGSADVVVLPSRGEGFNLPVAEAMAAGVPVIVTGVGGHMDFCDPRATRLVRWRYVAATSHLSTAHSTWAEPDVDDLADAMRDAFRAGHIELPAMVPPELGAAGHVQRLVAAAVRELQTPPPQPLRVAWISTWDVRCGVAEYSRHLIAHLPVTGQIARIAILADRRTTPGPTGRGDAEVRIAWEMGHPDGLDALVVATAREDARVVVLQHQPGLFHWDKLALLLGRLVDRIVVVTLHNTIDVLDAPADARDAALLALSGVARVLVHTIADLNRLKDLGLIENVALFPHGAPAPLDARPPRPLARDAAPLIGCYGFFLPDKGIPELIRAVAEVRRTWPAARLRLVNAAYDAEDSLREIARCRRLADELGMADAVEWHTDFLPDAASLALLAGCDAVVLPYQRSKEASSASLRLALASATPVMVTALPLFEEAGDAVMRCQGTSPHLIAADLVRFLGDADLRAATQAAARGWLADRDRAAVAARLHGMLLGLAASHDASARPLPSRRGEMRARVPAPELIAP